MGLRAEIDTEVAKAFSTDLADAVEPFVLKRKTITQTDDDWLTNTVSSETVEQEFHGRGVFGNYNQREIDGQTILATDVKITCLQSELNTEPKMDDIINGKRVVFVMADPVNVSWTIQLRGV